MTYPRIHSVNVGRASDAPWAGRIGRTAIDKRAVSGQVAVHALGLAGDEQANRKSHGGIHQAVYAYAREDLDWWSAGLGRALRDGEFGENLTATEVDVSETVIGERWRVGSALLEVSGPRIPCRVFQNWMGEQAWVRRFTAEARPGAYLRVLEEGELGAGDVIDVEHRPPHGFTVRDAFRVRNGWGELLRRVLDIPELPPSWHTWAANRLGDPGINRAWGEDQRSD